MFAKAGEAITRVHLLGWFLRALKALPSALLGGIVPLGTQRQIFYSFSQECRGGRESQETRLLQVDVFSAEKVVLGAMELGVGGPRWEEETVSA